MIDCNCNLCAKAKDGQPIPELCYHTKGVREEGYCRDFKPINGNKPTENKPNPDADMPNMWEYLGVDESDGYEVKQNER